MLDSKSGMPNIWILRTLTRKDWLREQEILNNTFERNRSGRDENSQVRECFFVLWYLM